MKILGLEFSSRERSAALAEVEGSELIRLISRAGDQTGMALIEALLAEARVEPAEIDVIAVGLGPGSYAGIRSSIAIGQGWQLARGTRLLGVSSVQVIARQAQRLGLIGRVSIVIDAQRGECYREDFLVSQNEAVVVEPLSICSGASLAHGSRIIGPDATQFSPEGRLIFPEAVDLVQIAAGRSDYLSGERLEPIYLRETNFVKAPPARFD